MYLRIAQISDAKMILEWRNDPDTRNNSFSRELISNEDHVKWLEKKLLEDSCRLYICCDGQENVGQIRIDVRENIGEVSYMVAPECRGKGYGTKILELAENEAKDLNTLIGFVKKSNIASAKCFEKNGYVKFETPEILCFVKNV